MRMVKPASLHSAASSEYFIILRLWAACNPSSKEMVSLTRRLVLAAAKQSTTVYPKPGSDLVVTWRDLQLWTEADPHFQSLPGEFGVLIRCGNWCLCCSPQVWQTGWGVHVANCSAPGSAQSCTLTGCVWGEHWWYGRGGSTLHCHLFCA